jgi:hypothetical protein
MSIDSALVALRLPADRADTGRGQQVVPVIRRFVAPPRWPQQRPILKIGGSYRIPDERGSYSGRSRWIHAHH